MHTLNPLQSVPPDAPAATAAPRQRGCPPASRAARGPRLAVLSLAAASLLLAASAQAGPLTVQSYSMANGASSNYFGYGDNAYGGGNGHGAWLSGGTGDLTNGVLGGDIGSDARNWVPYVLWLNFNPTITFDLGSTQAVNQLDAHFLAFSQAGVYLPGSAALRFSLDGGSYFGQTLVDFDHAPVASSEQRWLTLETATQQARYVQVQWLRDGGRPWMALSEVSLSYSAPATAQGVPEPASAALALGALGALAATRRRRPR